VKNPLTLLAIALAAALLLVPLPGAWRGLWQSKVLDLGHVPLFALLTVLVWRRLGPGVLGPIAIAVGLAAAGEVLQGLVGRSAGLRDFVRGALGALAAGAGIAAWQARLRPAQAFGWLLAVAALIAWPLYDAVPYLIDAWEGSRDFPVLAQFRTERELLRWQWRQAEMTRIPAAEGGAARVTFLPGPESYPYAALRPIRRDLRGYREVCFSLTVPGESLELVISLRSGSGDPDATTHYQEPRRLSRGPHVIRLDLAEVAPKANPRPLDLDDLWIIQLFLEHPQQARTIELHRVWVE
jgi:hypothetical protein